MTTIKLLNSELYKKMPWKNGGGITQEICRFPDNTDQYDFRLSIADVNQPGDFSFFEGYQRILSVLEGNGISLLIENSKTHILQKQEVFNFSGDWKIYSDLLNGSITDFNLIYNPNKFKARFQWLESKNKAYTIYSSASHFFIFNSKNLCKIHVNEEKKELNPLDSLWIQKDNLQIISEISIDNSAPIIMAELY